MQALARRHILATTLFALALALFISTVSAQGATPAGTVIINRAEATYTWHMLTRTAFSNEVHVMVEQIAGVQLSPVGSGHPNDPGFVPATSMEAAPGQHLYFPYRLTNTGNGTDTFDLTIHSESSSAALPALVNPVVYHDKDADGVPGGGDPVVSRLTLAAGESAALILAVGLPNNAVNGSSYFVAVHAESQFDPTAKQTDTWNHVQVDSQPVNLSIKREVAVNPLPTYPGIDGASNTVAGTGAQLIHKITIDNQGTTRVDGAVLLEPLNGNEMLLHDTYGPNKALRFKAVAVSLDPLVDPWATIVTDPSGDEAIQLVIDTLEPHQRAVLTYVTELAWQSGHTQLTKSATLNYERAPGVAAKAVSNDVIIAKEGSYAVRLVPTGVALPPGQPGLDVRPQAYLGEKVSFPVTVTNTGELPGTVNLAVAGTVPAGWTVQWFAGDGVTPLTDTNGDGRIDAGLIAPGQSAQVTAIVTVPSTEAQTAHAPYTFEFIGSFAENPSAADSTLARIDAVGPVDSLWQPLSLTAKQGPGVLPGQAVTYALLFGNNTDSDIYDITVTAELSDYLTDIALLHSDLDATAWIQDQIANDPGKMYEGLGLTLIPGTYNPADHTITWHIAHIAPGVGGKLVFGGNVIVSAGGGLVIDVQANMASNSPLHRATTPTARLTVLGEALTTHISARAPVVAVGDVNTYTTTITNVNPQQPFTDVGATIELPPGLTYRPGTARINGQAVADPVIDGDTLQFTVDNLPAAGTAHIVFAALVNASAEKELIVSARSSVTTQPGVLLESRTATVSTLVDDEKWGNKGTVVGRVTFGADVPVPAVRVVMDDGRYAITDGQGYYTLRDVDNGPRAMKLEPRSLKETDAVPGGIDPDQARLLRVIVPAGGIVVVDFQLTAQVIQVDTEERLLEEDDQ